MPLYERRCNDSECDKVSLALRRMADREKPVPCPTCGSETHLIMSATRTSFTFADDSPRKATSYGRGRQAQYIKDKHGLTPDGE